MMRAVRIAAPAKINLRLVVLGRETTGYHSLETLFAAVGLADELEIEEARTGIRLEVTGEVDTGPDESNLAYRAAVAFFERIALQPAVRIRVRKRIPAAAGLGGGSSDAAATLRGLNAFFGEPCSVETLLEIGAALGSDIPFLLSPTPFALAWGRGERLLPLPPLPRRPVLIAHPGVAIPTPEAFARLAGLRSAPDRPEPRLIDPVALTSWRGIHPLAFNDLEQAAREWVPQLDQAIRALRDHGARIALLSGSGAAIFGIFGPRSSLDDAERVVGQIGFKSWRTTTLTHWPAPRLRD